MTDSIGDLLGGKRFAEPPEIKLIKEFVEQRFKITPQVTISERQIIIGVMGGALAGALRQQLHELQERLDTDKRLVIRIQ